VIRTKFALLIKRTIFWSKVFNIEGCHGAKARFTKRALQPKHLLQGNLDFALFIERKRETGTTAPFG